MSRLQIYGRHRDAANAADTAAVAGSIGNVNSVAGSLSLIAQAVANSVNINAAVANESNINSAVANESNINSVVANESNIQLIIDNLSVISDAVNLITMTEYMIEVSLSNSAEVAGVNYNSLKDCYAYGLTVLQVGGTLKVNVAAETIVEPAGQLFVDGNRLNLKVQGVTTATSIIDMNSSGDNIALFVGFHTFDDVSIINHTGTLAAITAISCQRVELIQVDITSGANTAIDTEKSGIYISACNLTAARNTVVAVHCPLIVIKSSDITTTRADGNATCLTISGGSKADLNIVSYFANGANTGSNTAIAAFGMSDANTYSNNIYGPNITVNSNPVIDTYGNNRSYISS